MRMIYIVQTYKSKIKPALLLLVYFIFFHFFVKQDRYQSYVTISLRALSWLVFVFSNSSLSLPNRIHWCSFCSEGGRDRYCRVEHILGPPEKAGVESPSWLSEGYSIPNNCIKMPKECICKMQRDFI